MTKKKETYDERIKKMMDDYTNLICNINNKAIQRAESDLKKAYDEYMQKYYKWDPGNGGKPHRYKRTYNLWNGFEAKIIKEKLRGKVFYSLSYGIKAEYANYKYHKTKDGEGIDDEYTGQLIYDLAINGSRSPFSLSEKYPGFFGVGVITYEIGQGDFFSSSNGNFKQVLDQYKNEFSDIMEERYNSEIDVDAVLRRYFNE